MNGDLERRLSDHIEEGALFQGEMLGFVDNFNKRVLPSLVTSPGCDARHSELKAELVGNELDASRDSRRIWSNRIWSAVLAVALLVLGTWFGSTRGDGASAAADEAGNVPRHSVAVPR
ncbi:MAG: hypothetical protein KOO60_11060 [Gemmatimonadales bacterium]|nr:hypothetical protein [Gemmatimonadales bacterium]